MIDIKQTYFELFELEVGFQLDGALLSERYRALQQVLHPDRFAHLSDQERLLSVQYTAFLNEAFATLKSPLRRAQYLLTLKGVDTVSETSVPLEPMFLMQQMELREALAEIDETSDPDAVLQDLQQQVDVSVNALRGSFEQHYGQGNYESAAGDVRKIQFFDKLSREIESAEDALFD